MEFAIPAIVVSFFVLIMVISFIIAFIKACIEEKKIKILKRAGFERQLYSTPSFGNHFTYWYVKKDVDDHYFERDLRDISIKELKKRYS